MLPHQVPQWLGKREDDVEVRNRQEFLSPGGQPGLRVLAVALGTGPVTAGVVDVVLPAAVVADIELPAQCGGSAVAQVPQRPAVAGQGVLAKAVQIAGPWRRKMSATSGTAGVPRRLEVAHQAVDGPMDVLHGLLGQVEVADRASDASMAQ